MLLTSMTVPMQVCVTTLHFCDMYYRHLLMSVRETLMTVCVMTQCFSQCVVDIAYVCLWL